MDSFGFIRITGISSVVGFLGFFGIIVGPKLKSEKSKPKNYSRTKTVCEVEISNIVQSLSIRI